MKKLLFMLMLSLAASTATAQDHIVRYNPKTAQQTTTKPTAKPTTKPNAKPKPTTKPKPSSRPAAGSLCPDGNHPHAIDLGLPSGTKWSCCNVGANRPDDYGGYYAWGETETKSTYDWKNYTHCDGTEGSCHNLGSNISGTQYDVAHVKWGGSWRMPTQEQQDELRYSCTYIWTTLNGVQGGRFTSKKNGKSIFLPAAGCRSNSDFDNAGMRGYFWSSTLASSFIAYRLYFYSDGTESDNSGDRFIGFTVRPVSRN